MKGKGRREVCAVVINRQKKGGQFWKITGHSFWVE